MKLKIDKKIENGSFRVDIATHDFTAEEASKMGKFGSPLISIAPRSLYVGGGFVRALPVHAISNSFTFKTEEEADKFVSDIKDRIKTAMEALRAKEDKFTEAKEFEL